MLRIFAIAENSMAPEYLEGDFVLAAKIPFAWWARPGVVIIFHHPSYGMLIKRVQAITPDRRQLSVIGAASNSVDSRTFGPISSDEVFGVVIWHISQKKITPLYFQAYWLKIALCVLSLFLLITLLRLLMRRTSFKMEG